MLLFQKDGTILLLNGPAKSLFGDITVDDSKNLQSLVFENDREIFESKYRELINGAVNNSELKFRFTSASNEVIHATLKIVPESDDNEFFIGQLVDITDLVQTSSSLKESEEKYRKLVEHSPFCIHSINTQGQITSMNPAGLEMLGGVQEGEVCGIHYLDFVGKNNESRINDLLEQAYLGTSSFFDFDVDVEGNRVYFKSNFVPIKAPNGNVVKLMGVTQDVTAIKNAEEERLQAEITKETNRVLQNEIEERKKIEAQLRKSNEEKKALLKEIHHRVKNNLQLVSSMLNLQAAAIDNEDFSQAITDSQNRIKSMALIHERLYQNETLSEINFKRYFRTLIDNKLNTLQTSDLKVDINVSIPEVNFETNLMVPLGLILNEWITNSIKHAFKDRSEGKIEIAMEKRSDFEYELSYWDNGPGLSNVKKDPERMNLGMELIDSFVDQIDGSMIISSTSKGLRYDITFPEYTNI